MRGSARSRVRARSRAFGRGPVRGRALSRESVRGSARGRVPVRSRAGSRVCGMLPQVGAARAGT